MKVCIVGASRGIGLGLVDAYLARGADVLAVVRTPNDELRARAMAGRLRIEIGDLRDPELGTGLIRLLHGMPLDRLIVNGGIMGPADSPAEPIAPAALGELFLTNALGPMRVVEALAERLALAGVVACLSSQMGSVSLAKAVDMPLYGASKAALNSLLQSWAARQPLRFALLALHPGWVQTEMGGDGAPVSVAQSVEGLVATIEGRVGRPGCAFLDYRGEVLPW